MTSLLRTTLLLPLIALLAPACAPTAEDSASAEGGVIGRLGSGTIDPNRPTHLIVVGYSHGQGDQFVRAALTRGRRYKEAFPDQ